MDDISYIFRYYGLKHHIRDLTKDVEGNDLYIAHRGRVILRLYHNKYYTYGTQPHPSLLDMLGTRFNFAPNHWDQDKYE